MEKKQNLGNISYKSSSYNSFIQSMNIDLKSIKIEPDDFDGQWNLKREGPFKVDHGKCPINPIYQAVPRVWTSFQNAKYAAYILSNKNVIEDRPTLMMWEVFKDMSNFVESRNFRQCKAHHFELLKVAPSIQKIIGNLQLTFKDFDHLLRIELQSYKQFAASSKSVNNIILSPLFTSQGDEEKHKSNLQQAQFRTMEEYLPENLSYHRNTGGQSLYVDPVSICIVAPLTKPTPGEWLECHRLFIEWTHRLRQLQLIATGF